MKNLFLAILLIAFALPTMATPLSFVKHTKTTFQNESVVKSTIVGLEVLDFVLVTAVINQLSENHSLMPNCSDTVNCVSLPVQKVNDQFHEKINNDKNLQNKDSVQVNFNHDKIDPYNII